MRPACYLRLDYPAAAGRVDVALPDKQEEVATSRESLQRFLVAHE
jgi:hypothetical protein